MHRRAARSRRLQTACSRQYKSAGSAVAGTINSTDPCQVRVTGAVLCKTMPVYCLSLFAFRHKAAATTYKPRLQTKLVCNVCRAPYLVKNVLEDAVTADVSERRVVVVENSHRAVPCSLPRGLVRL
eukprot:364481-Chlamydomonas_euryale.AAC.14